MKFFLCDLLGGFAAAEADASKRSSQSVLVVPWQGRSPVCRAGLCLSPLAIESTGRFANDLRPYMHSKDALMVTTTYCQGDQPGPERSLDVSRGLPETLAALLYRVSGQYRL